MKVIRFLFLTGVALTFTSFAGSTSLETPRDCGDKCDASYQTCTGKCAEMDINCKTACYSTYVMCLSNCAD